MNRYQKNRSGFTLIELLVVIVVIGILSAIGIATFTGYFSKSRDAKRQSYAHNIATALKAAYASDAVHGFDLGDMDLQTTIAKDSVLVPEDARDTGFAYYYAFEPNNTDEFAVFACNENTPGEVIVDGTAGMTNAINAQAGTICDAGGAVESVILASDSDFDGVYSSITADINGDALAETLSVYKIDSGAAVSGGGGMGSGTGTLVLDYDGDGIPNTTDPDINGDGTLNADTADGTADGVLHPANLNADGDTQANGSVDATGTPTGSIADPDIDGDNVLNVVDTDIDGDGVENLDAALNPLDLDIDNDGVLNAVDPDVDNDGILNGDDTMPNGAAPLCVGSTDIDNDSISNGADDDVDGDSILNVDDTDIDGDGTLNAADTNPAGCGANCIFDGSGGLLECIPM